MSACPHGHPDQCSVDAVDVIRRTMAKQYAAAVCMNATPTYRQREPQMRTQHCADVLADKIERIPGVDCWIWTGFLHRDGYGRMRFNGRAQMAHRVSYQLAKGEISPGLVIRHQCDTPACVNPGHLTPGTHRDNSADMVSRGRSRGLVRAGEANPAARLTAHDVSLIRADPRPVKEIAAQYGVGATHVYKILNREKWRHLQS